MALKDYLNEAHDLQALNTCYTKLKKMKETLDIYFRDPIFKDGMRNSLAKTYPDLVERHDNFIWRMEKASEHIFDATEEMSKALSMIEALKKEKR